MEIEASTYSFLVYLQLSIISSHSWVSRGNNLRSISHWAVKVILKLKNKKNVPFRNQSLFKSEGVDGGGENEGPQFFFSGTWVVLKGQKEGWGEFSLIK